MRTATLFAITTALLFGACAEPADDDSDHEAELAPEQLLDKADAPTFTGLYATAATALHEGDIPNLQLITGGTYVRRRCYHAGCALAVGETDHYDTYTSSAGKTYVRFYAFRAELDAASGERTQIPVVADVYEIAKPTSTTIKLRKSYSSRWVTLTKKSAASLCTGDQGTWSAGNCECPGSQAGWSDDGYIGFVPGLGGCTTIPGAGESECDDTEGFYTDDDSTLVGTYCQCGKGSYLSSTGCTSL